MDVDLCILYVCTHMSVAGLYGEGEGEEDEERQRKKKRRRSGTDRLLDG